MSGIKRVLLDANIPRKLSRNLTGFAVATARQLGWSELLDGPLLDVMAGQFDVLVTMDKSLPFEQNLKDRPFAVIILRARSNSIVDLVPLVPGLVTAIAETGPGKFWEIRLDPAG